MHIHAAISAVSPPRRAVLVGGMAVVVTALAAFIYANWSPGASGTTESATVPPVEWRVRASAELDAALAAYDSTDRDGAAAHLRTAATTLRDRARARSATASGALTAASLDLDAMALEVEKGRVRERTAITRVLARAQLAQAEHHRGLASLALQSGRTTAAGQELAMAVDHYERAQVDAGASIAAAAVAAKSVRGLSLELLRGSAPTDAADGIRRFGSDVQRSASATRGAG